MRAYTAVRAATWPKINYNCDIIIQGRARAKEYNLMHELMFQAGVKGMSERSKLIPCIVYRFYDILPCGCTNYYIYCVHWATN